MTEAADNQITVYLPDGSARVLPNGATGADLAASIGPRLAKAAIAVVIDGALFDLGVALPPQSKVAVVTADSEAGRHILRHSTAHVMAQAVLALYPGARYAIGPAIDDGFYYDFDLPDGQRFHDEDLEVIGKKMRQIIAEAQPFVREEHQFSEALALFSTQPYKREIIEKVRDGQSDGELSSEAGADTSAVSTYRNTGDFVDLCLGPHVPATSYLGHFKLMRVAGAYWRGDEKRPQLQRIYGTAWESAAALKEYLHRLEEAERRDHRKLGAELDLFSFPEEIGSGLAIFHPKGGLVRRLMEEYSRTQHERSGYEFVNSPHITKSDLFEVSGHLQSFAEAMFPPMELDDHQQYYLKPMNCPFHILVYKSRQRSYRELPMRLFEFGTVYRYEKSGVLHGLTRVRGLTQDDSHIFCSREQLRTELDSVLHFVLALLSDFGLDDFELELSTRPEDKAFGSIEEWDEATEALRQTAAAMNLELRLDEGGGAFYGPKISVQVRDAIGRSWQMSTIQLDFQLPQRFEMEYVGSDNARHRPIMIHRALFGSVERFFAVLLEHYAGALPLWLSPVQVRVLSVAEAFDDAARAVSERLLSEGLRVEFDAAVEPLGARIRRGKLEKVPYLLVVGAEDVEKATVGVNARHSEKAARAIPLERFITIAMRQVTERRNDLVSDFGTGDA